MINIYYIKYNLAEKQFLSCLKQVYGHQAPVSGVCPQRESGAGV